MTRKKGIILAGGKSTRLYPLTKLFGKPFLPVADKPMIFYPLATLLEAGIRDILIITAPRDKNLFQSLLGDGASFGASISYIEQPVARGIADAFILGEEFIAGDPVCLILCDNFFHGKGLLEAIETGWGNAAKDGATIFCQYVEHPAAYGVAEFDDAGRVTRLVEKPEKFISNWAVTGLYIYDGCAPSFAKKLSPSRRGELEITDLNSLYLTQKALHSIKLDKSFQWFDLGTYASILKAANLVMESESSGNTRIGCPYIAAYKAGFIDQKGLLSAAEVFNNSSYAEALKKHISK